MKPKIIVFLLIFSFAALLIFFGYYIGTNEADKARALAQSALKTDFDPEEINIDEIKSDAEFAGKIPEYRMFFSGLIEKDASITFLEIAQKYKDNTLSFDSTGERSDGEIVSLNFTGIKLNDLFADILPSQEYENVIVYGSDMYSVVFSKAEIDSDDLYLAWKKEGQYLNPSEDGVLKIVFDQDKTSRWIKNPVYFEFIGNFDYSVPLVSDLPIETITFLTEQQMFTLAIGGAPKIDIDDWELKFTGLIDNNLVLSYDEILSLPQKTVYATLETISNPIGGPSMGNAFWTGVPFRNIVELLGISSEAVEIVFYCVDGYSTSVTVEESLKDDVILAYKMNGQTLTDEHGYPVRMVLPDKYGMKWAKWIDKIEIVDYDYKGYWERQGWSDYAGRDRPDKRFD